jgi:outer membrane protein TolC
MSITRRTIQIIAFAVVIGTFFGLIIYNLGHIPSAAAADSPQVASTMKPSDTPETDLQKLLLERKQILQKIANTIAKQYSHGVTNAEQVRQANLDLLNADLDLAKTPAERIEIRSQIVRLYKEKETELTSQVNAGKAPSLDLEKAKVARLTAEIELVKEQLAAKSTTK